METTRQFISRVASSCKIHPLAIYFRGGNQLMRQQLGLRANAIRPWPTAGAAPINFSLRMSHEPFALLD
jgi:hypothetical protein